MKVTFLGTGTSQGVPVIACKCETCRSLDYRDIRTRTSVHIQTDQSLIIDTGPDFRQQVLRERISTLDAVLMTHQHRDHTAGLDELRSYNFAQKRNMPVYGTKPVTEQLIKDFGYIFSGPEYPGLPRIDLIDIGLEPFEIGNTRIIPIQVMHYKLPVTAFRIEDFTYVTDANLIEEDQFEKLKNSKVLVLNALQIKEHISHYNLEQALKVIEQLEPDQAYLTHISHNLGRFVDVSASLPKNVALAYDGLKLEM